VTAKTDIDPSLRPPLSGEGENEHAIALPGLGRELITGSWSALRKAKGPTVKRGPAVVMGIEVALGGGRLPPYPADTDQAETEQRE
jgi:hypothetical protein